MLNMHCNKNGIKIKIKKNANTEIRTQEVWVQNPSRCPLRYGLKTDKKIIYAKVINRKVGKMYSPHPRKGNALGKHM